jgi:hypothetical protein
MFVINCVVDVLLMLAMLFFLVLPMMDRKSMWMRLWALGGLVAIFAVSLAHPPRARAEAPVRACRGEW